MRRRTTAIMIAVAVFIAAIVVALAATVTQASNHTEKIEVPICDVEDGSTMPLCLWHGSDGRDYLNYDYGAGFKIVKVHY